MQRAGHPRAFQRLRSCVFGARRHQARHFRFRDRDFLTAIVGELDVGDSVVGGFAHELETSLIMEVASLTSGAASAQ